jgi:stage II sporulation protein AA (anti-sigma F factor antagonist)
MAEKSGEKRALRRAPAPFDPLAMADPHKLQIEPILDGETGHLTLRGQLMAESRYDLEQILRLWTESGVHFVSISCKELRFVDSAGLSTLIGALHRLRRLGGELVLCEMSPAVDSLFRVTTLENYFTFKPTVRQGREHLARLAAERRDKGAPEAAEIKSPGKPKPRTKPMVKAPKKP